MRPPIISPIRWPLHPRRPILPHFRGLSDVTLIDQPPVGVLPSLWGDGTTSGPEITDDGGMLPEITVSNTPLPPAQPVWPLVVILGVAGYTLFWMGGHK